MKLLPLVVAATEAALYDAGKPKGDSVVGMDSNHIVKVPLNTEASLFGMSKDILWISNNGAVSVNSLDATDGDDVMNNVVFAPLWGTSGGGLKPSDGKLFYRVVNDRENDGAFSQINFDISVKSPSFQLDSALLVTFKNSINPMDAQMRNNYQLVVAKGSANGVTQNHVIFNYHQMDWVPDDVEFGIFAALKETQHCGKTLNLPTTPDELRLGSNIDTATDLTKGKWIMSFGSDLECEQSRFRTECPVPTDGSNSNYRGMLTLNNDDENWLFYAQHDCIPGFRIDKNTSYRTSTCEYDADYYDARWSSDSPTCIDFNAVKDFKASVQATKIDGEDAQTALQNNPSRDDGLGVIENAINQLGDLAGLNNNHISSITITDGDKPTSVDEAGRSEDASGPVIVEFEITVPLAVKDKVTEDDIKENFINILNEQPSIDGVMMDPNTVTVQETTAECLTDCLGCRGVLPCSANPPPIPFDACCGGCPADNPNSGKPYSTLVQACCTNGWDGEIYDPDQKVCCKGVVIDMAEYLAMSNPDCE